MPIETTETIAPIPPNAGENYVANVTTTPSREVAFQDLPERAQSISTGMKKVASSQASPEDRLKFAQEVDTHTKESSTYNPNQKPQWGKMFVAAISDNWNDVYKYYNGGATKEEEAKDINGNTYWKETNEIGYTGVLKDAHGRSLSGKQKEDLVSRGGVYTKSDETALKSLPWVNGKYNSELINKGLTSQLDVTTNAAYNAARTAGSSNHNIDEQIYLAKKNRNVLDYFSKLSSDDRARVLGNINRYNTINTNKSNETNKAVGANASDLKTLSNTANANIGIGGAGQEGGAGVPPPGTKGSLGVGMGASGVGQTNVGANAREANASSASSGQTLQEQQNLQSAIMQVMQGVIKTPQEFQDFARLQALNSANEENAGKVPDFVKPAGYVDLTKTDVYTGGADALLMNRVQQQRNNALMAAWSAQLYKAAKDTIGTGKVVDRDTLSKEFAASPLYQAINNTYEDKLHVHLKGQGKHPKGTLMVNESNQLVLK